MTVITPTKFIPSLHQYQLPTMEYPFHHHHPISTWCFNHQYHQPIQTKQQSTSVILEGLWLIWSRIDLWMEAVLSMIMWTVQSVQLPPNIRLVKTPQLPPRQMMVYCKSILYILSRQVAMPNSPATPNNKCSIYDDKVFNAIHVSCCPDWHSDKPDSKKIMENETTTFAHEYRKKGNQDIPLVLWAVNQNLAVFIPLQTQSTVAIYITGVVTVWINTQPGIISHIAEGEGKWIGAIVSAKRKEVYKDWESLCFCFGFMVFCWVYVIHLGLG